MLRTMVRNTRDADSLTDLARYDLGTFSVGSMEDRAAALKALKPTFIALGWTNVLFMTFGNLPYLPSAADSAPLHDMTGLDSDWILRQCGTTIVGTIDETATSIEIASANVSVYGVPVWETGVAYMQYNACVQWEGIPYRCRVAHTSVDFSDDLAGRKWTRLSCFVVGDMALLDDEIVRVTAIHHKTLTVTRGYAHGRPAASHTSGASIAALIPMYAPPTPDVSFVMDMRSAGWRAYNLARTVAAAEAYDGVFCDQANGDPSRFFRTQYRTIDTDGSGHVQLDLWPFDDETNAGLEAFASALREALPDKFIVPNAPSDAWRPYADGFMSEQYVRAGMTVEAWHQSVVGPNVDLRPSLLAWPAATMSNLQPPNTVTNLDGTGHVLSKQEQRFIICTGLLVGAAYMVDLSATNRVPTWFEEFAAPLGEPSALAYRLASGGDDLLAGAGAFTAPWSLVTSGVCAASQSLQGGVCTVAVTTPDAQSRGSLRWPVAVLAGATYRATFTAQTDATRYPLAVRLNDSVSTIGTSAVSAVPEARRFDLTFTALHTGTGYLGFSCGDRVGAVSISEVEIRAVVPEVWRRDFAGGVALVNAELVPATIDLGGAYWKLTGTDGNDGTMVTSVTLDAQDGLVLLGTGNADALVLDTAARWSQTSAGIKRVKCHPGRFYSVGATAKSTLGGRLWCFDAPGWVVSLDGTTWAARVTIPAGTTHVYIGVTPATAGTVTARVGVPE